MKATLIGRSHCYEKTLKERLQIAGALRTKTFMFGDMFYDLMELKLTFSDKITIIAYKSLQVWKTISIVCWWQHHVMLFCFKRDISISQNTVDGVIRKKYYLKITNK